MRVRSDSRRTIALLVALIVPTLACSKKSTNATSPDEVAPRHEDRPAGASRDPLAELAALEQEMQRLGLPVAVAAELATEAEAESRDAAGIGDGEADNDEPVDAEESLAESAEPPAPAPTPTGAADMGAPRKRDERQYCSNVCDLSQAICELESQICSLAEGHGEDPTYGDACRRAGEDCDIADEQCDSCRRR